MILARSCATNNGCQPNPMSEYDASSNNFYHGNI